MTLTGRKLVRFSVGDVGSFSVSVSGLLAIGLALKD